MKKSKNAMKKSDEIKNSYLVAASVASASLLAGCGDSDTPEIKQWKAAPGTNGFINLEDVEKAFKKNQKADEFEKRVNEIFEGDSLVVFKSSQKTGGSGFVYYAYEDLNKDAKVTSSDDLLFTLTVANNRAMLQGAGVNKYYKSSWAYKPAEERREETYYRSRYGRSHFSHWYWGRGWGGYYTPRDRYDSNLSHTKEYRGTSGFTQQVQNNAAYEKRAAAKHGTGFRQSAVALSPVRRKYVKSVPVSKTMKATKGTSGWGVRANKGIFSSYSGAKSSGAKSSGSSSRGGGFFSRFRGSSGFGV
jgi:hypothetical protein